MTTPAMTPTTAIPRITEDDASLREAIRYATPTITLTPSMISSTEMPEKLNTLAAAAMMFAGWARCATLAHPPTTNKTNAHATAALRAFLATPVASATPANASSAPPLPAKRLNTNKGHWMLIYTSPFHSAVFFERIYTVAGWESPGSGRWWTLSLSLASAAATAFDASLSGSSKSP